MNSDNLVQLVQKSFRITLGATTSIVEVLQNPDQRQANFSEMRSKWNERIEDWETKGEVTEQEARKFVDTMWQQQQNRSSGIPENPETSDSAPNTEFRVNFPNFADSLSQFWRNQNIYPGYSENVDSSATQSNTSSTVDPQVQRELENLTAQIAAMRAELETLRQLDNQ
ncbi:hypothetical protein [Merismopedia glauca]|uniref:Uncharacterized protein n=1 Tax=Merismopedia glauca CCAP 1448/3 TaxID=1296344 RepID=A0A2T1BXB3_9CYAN|nr:hypothetical protein [Merismopedia glauca]PSB00650.1 hypothetical protein C7B64_22395 [Merismopedia glauca CCAP 1448/3]